MKSTRFLLAALTFSFLLGSPLPVLADTTVAEGQNGQGDFSNNSPGTNYNLTSGTYVFSGTVTSGTDSRDYFRVTVPAGLRITQVTKTTSDSHTQSPPSNLFVSFNNESISGLGTGTFTGAGATPYPLPPGTYQAFTNADFSTGSSWTVTILVDGPADYDITTAGGVMTVTNNTNNPDILAVSQPSAGSIGFAAPNRTFSVNGGHNTTDSSIAVSLSGITAITINGGSGGETFNVGAFGGTTFPSLTVNGGAGNDTVNFMGNITFDSGRNLTVNLQSGGGSPGVDAINVAGAQLIVQGTGAIDLECSQSVSIYGGAVVQTTEGNITVLANQQAVATAGDFTGVTVDGAGTMLKATSLGTVTVNGRGGDAPGGYQLGVNVVNGAKIRGGGVFGGSGVFVTGTGGASRGLVNRGVTVDGTNSAITSGGSTVTVMGTGGANSSDYGIGVSVLNGGSISSGGQTVAVTGTGAGAAGSGSNQGVEIGGAGSLITAPGLGVTISGTAGPGASSGLLMANSAAVTTPVGQGKILINADSVSLDDTVSISTADPQGYVQFNTVAATHINLGGVDATGTLGLSVAELARITTHALNIYGVANGDLTISAPIAFASATQLTLSPGSGGLHATASGTDINTAGITFYLGGPLNMPITGPTADTNFPQLNVTGGVNLGLVAPVPLNLAGTTYAGTAGQTFTILKNGGTFAISGTFQNLPEGALLTWPGSPLYYAKVSYVGGTSGRDVVLTLVASSANVTTNADIGPGSLRAAIAYCGANPGAESVTFDPSLSGQTITLASQIAISDTAGVTIDASSLPNGLTLSGGGTNRIFLINSGSIVTLKALTFANGHDTTANGGGAIINNGGAVTVNNSTFTANTTATTGGAIRNLAGSMVVNQSTFAGNSSTGNGGAIASSATTTINQCTISHNASTAGANGGGGIVVSANTLALRNSIVAGNTAPAGQPPEIFYSGTLTKQGANIAQGIVDGSGTLNGPGTITKTNPLLAPLNNYGGPTQTMALLPGSPARDASLNSTITSDQRGFPIVGTADIGAYEAGTLSTNYNAYIWESLPTAGNGTVTDPLHAQTFDYDGDGVSNYNEWLAFTDSTDPTSYFRLTQFTRSGSNVNITFPTVLGRNYSVEYTTTLGNPTTWTPITATFAGTGSPVMLSPSILGFTKYFLRVHVGP